MVGKKYISMEETVFYESKILTGHFNGDDKMRKKVLLNSIDETKFVEL